MNLEDEHIGFYLFIKRTDEQRCVTFPVQHTPLWQRRPLKNIEYARAG